MDLIDETISILEKTIINGVSLLDQAYLSHNPEWGTWSNESLDIVQAALDKAAKLLSEEQLIEEYNEMADHYDCDHITDWDYNFNQMELEMFIDEVYQSIKDLKNQ
ncbi:MAG: hypothetical protein GY846_23655 [Deltaproteobacteria bacterium]|nr:hypothetical protein [Deltaproteobacteria bacterium]